MTNFNSIAIPVRAGYWICLLLLWAAADLQAAPGMEQEVLRQRIEQLRAQGELRIGDATIASTRLIPELYRRRSFRPAWTGREEAAQGLLRLVAESREEGLDPADYHFGQLQRMLNGADAMEGRALVDRDLCLTDALVRLLYHLRFGKVDPEQLDPDWNFDRSLSDIDPVAAVQGAIDADSLVAYLQTHLPRRPVHDRLKQALARYRAIEQAGGWPQVPAGPALKPGSNDPRLVPLRERLRTTGDLAGPAAPEPRSFDSRLEQAVRRFQQRQGLDADGVVGPQTLRELNRSVSERIDQIRVNLERSRWISLEDPGDYLIVDIAGFRARLVRSGQVLWDQRAQVGKPYRKTPVFRATLNHLVLNPTWTIPPTILKQDILPRLRRHPDYLEQKQIRVLDRQGNTIAADELDWSQQSTADFPYILRQDPGPNNALGRIKFMFPNSHFVYLHDTPHKSLFEHNSRAFSSGCIRVEGPFRLAELLLDDPQQWSRAQILEQIEAGETQTLFLRRPIPVLLLYWTVSVDDDGTVRFKPDIYDRDSPVLQALNGAFRFSPPRGLAEWIHTSGFTDQDPASSSHVQE